MDLNRDNKRKNFHEASLKVFVILSIRQIQIKIILGFHLPLVKVASMTGAAVWSHHRQDLRVTQLSTPWPCSSLSCLQEPGNGNHLMFFT